MAKQQNPTRTRLLILALIIVVAAAVWMNAPGFSGLGGDDDTEKAELTLSERLATLKALPAIAVDRPLGAAALGAGRNLFNYTESPEAVRLKEKKKRDQQQRRAAEVERQQERERVRQEEAKRNPRPKPPKRTPPPPNFNYTYVGYIGAVQEEDYVAVLAKPGASKKPKKEDLRVVKIGDVIDEQFVIKKIDLDTVTVGYTNPAHRGKTKPIDLVAKKEARGSGRRSSRRGR